MEKKNKLDKEVKSMEERSQKLTETRDEMYKQLGKIEKVFDEKKEERDTLNAKVQVKQAQLESKQRELEEKELQVKQLREKVRQIL